MLNFFVFNYAISIEIGLYIKLITIVALFHYCFYFFVVLYFQFYMRVATATTIESIVFDLR